MPKKKNKKFASFLNNDEFKRLADAITTPKYTDTADRIKQAYNLAIVPHSPILEAMSNAVEARDKFVTKDKIIMEALDTYSRIQKISTELIKLLENEDNYAIEHLTGGYKDGTKYEYTSQHSGKVYKGALDIDKDIILNSMAQLAFASHVCREETAKHTANTVGRSSLQGLTQFILENIRLFDELSHKPFTIRRHKSPNGRYEPVTDGHKFICILNEVLKSMIFYEEKSYTDKNLYNACEAAIKIRRTETRQ